MSTTSSSNVNDAQSPHRRMKLKLSTPPSHNQSSHVDSTVKEESSSPIRPSYSPVTPTLSHTPLNARGTSQQWIDEPEPLPISLDDNPDAIALRATISLLQIQRQQTLRDMRSLDKTKQEAMNDPETFVKVLKDGRLRKPVPSTSLMENDDDDDENDDNGNDARTEQATKFGQLPNAQDIARCPPIEWSKYHVTGEPLERLHELQKEYPGLTEAALTRGLQPQPHEITAPYRPFIDKIEPQTGSTDRQYDK